ncbi:MAG: response regulator [Gallionella sp.]|jgi:DNA-binding response OmpR family regulator
MTENLNVLVVDDEPDVCWVLDVLLRKHGFTVVTMSSGAAALRWLGDMESACSLILVDAKLGDIEGVELAKRIRTDTSCAASVILVSGYFYKDDSVVQDSLNAGIISAFVTKPFRHEEILGAIHAVLSTTLRNNYDS